MNTEQMLMVVHAKERRALKALIKIYGDGVSDVLNGLHTLAARIAIAHGVSPEDFAAGIKHHWDFLAKEINDYVEPRH